MSGRFRLSDSDVDRECRQVGGTQFSHADRSADERLGFSENLCIVLGNDS